MTVITVSLTICPAEGLTSAQVTGIAIGVLLAIAFVIAMAITVARRMGKYS